MQKAYIRYKKYFTILLSRDIPEEDKKKIKNLLKKPWILAFMTPIGKLQVMINHGHNEKWYRDAYGE